MGEVDQHSANEGSKQSPELKEKTTEHVFTLDAPLSREPARWLNHTQEMFLPRMLNGSLESLLYKRLSDSSPEPSKGMEPRGCQR